MSEREHTWCKDKSLPEFYEKPDIIHANTEAFVKPPPTAFSTSSDSMLTSRENRPILPLSQLNKVHMHICQLTLNKKESVSFLQDLDTSFGDAIVDWSIQCIG